MKNKFNQLEEIINRKGIRILSVDVFDTLLLRTTQPELSRFYDFCRMHAQSLPERCSASIDDLFVARLSAGKKLYHKAKSSCGGYEVTYTEILQLISQNIKIPREEFDGFVQKCLASELALELARLSPRKELWNFLRDKKKQGYEIVFCSDMYLDGGSIGYLLEEGMNESLLGLVYSSSDWQKTKRNGTLFKVLMETKNVHPNEILHIGDDLKSDFLEPQALGVQAFYWPRSWAWRSVSQLRKIKYSRKLKSKNKLR